jgi:transposase
MTPAPRRRLPSSPRTDAPRPMQRPPPSEDAVWKLATVNVDAHVEVDRHLYSVPFPFIGECCAIRLTATRVEVFHDERRVAAHRRSHRLGGYSTDPEHLPASYRRPVTWTPGRILTWAARCGPATAQMAEQILSHRLHPEQGFRGCLALIGLSRRYGPERVEAACKEALRLGAFRYRSVKAILDRDLASLSSRRQR